jgi:hypothetical protein
MTYQLKVIKDYPIGFWPLDETSGSTAADISGCGNNGTITGGFTTGIIPLVSGGITATNITSTRYLTIPCDNDYYGSTADGGFADENSSDNDFTLECWIYPKFTTANSAPIMADDNTSIGIYYEAGNIVFQLESERLDYSLPIVSAVHHIVATYTPSEMILYVDGELAASKPLSNFAFTNAELTLKIGPTANASDSFLIDAPAVYRYALSQSIILEHYSYNGVVPPVQIADPENGTLFEILDDNVSTQYKFSYPANRPLDVFFDDDLEYNQDKKYLGIIKSTGSKTVVVEDAIAIPLGFDIDSSKIEWDSNDGVSVRTKVEGGSYQTAYNGRAIPQFKLGGTFSSERVIYLEITFTTTDASKYIPKLFNLSLSFYNDQKVFAYTNSDYIYTLDGFAGSTDNEIAMGRDKHRAISRHPRNGLRTGSAAGFRVSTLESTKTVELFFTPSTTGANTLFYSPASTGFTETEYSWNGLGSITKTNIAAIYVNGINQTSQTNVSNVFTAGDLHHVVLVFTASATGDFRFNYKSSGGPSSLYQYISYYPLAFSQSNALAHYNMHIGIPALSVDDSSFTLTENAVEYYNNDWIVVQSV